SAPAKPAPTLSSLRRAYGSCSERVQVVPCAAEQVLAKVEETRPERAAIGRRLELDGGREAFERPHEHGQLEIGRRHAVGIGRDPCPVEDGRPVDELGGPGLTEPRRALGTLRLQLEEVALERRLEPPEGTLHTLRGFLERRGPRDGGGR